MGDKRDSIFGLRMTKFIHLGLMGDELDQSSVCHGPGVNIHKASKSINLGL